MDRDIRRFAAEISAAYARFPDFKSLSIPAMRQAAEAVRAPWRWGGPQMSRVEDVIAETSSRRVRLRIYRPWVELPLPVLVYMHGGGWTIFSLDTHDRLMREYAAAAGIAVVGVDYALSPEAKFPRALNEVADAVDWLVARADGLGLDRDRLALGGDSAGANLAVAAALVLRDRGGLSPIRGLLLNYGLWDDCLDTASHRRFTGPKYMLTSEEIAGFWRHYLVDPADAANPLARPLHADLRGLPPAYLTVAECDVLHDENLEMGRRLRHAGVKAEVVVYKGATHSFLEAMSIAELSRRAISDGANWLAQQLAGLPVNLARTRQLPD